MKDLSDLHLAAINSGQPEMFKKTVECIVWRACLRQQERRSEKTTTTISPKGCADGGRFKWFSGMPKPEPLEFLADPLVPKAFPLVMHGAGGSAKSFLLLLLAMIHATPAGGNWLGSPVTGNGRSLIVDFELSEHVFNSRVHKVAKGLGFEPSDFTGLAYYEVGDQDTADAFEEVYGLCQEHGFDLVVIDSVGPALEGDAGAAKDVIKFHRARISPFMALGATPALVDHQARAYSEEEYQTKGAFGSGYKEHLGRSVIQVQPRPSDEDSATLVVRVRHKKANFTRLTKPFDVWLSFSEDRVVIERRDVNDDDLITEKTISLESRILRAVRKHGCGTITAIAEWLEHNRGSVGNATRGLEKQGHLIEVGKEGNAIIYGLPDADNTRPEKTTITTSPREHADGGGAPAGGDDTQLSSTSLPICDVDDSSTMPPDKRPLETEEALEAVIGSVKDRQPILTTKRSTASDIYKGSGSDSIGDGAGGEPEPNPTSSTFPKEYRGDGDLHELIDTPEALAEIATRLKETEGPIGFDVETYPREETARSLDPRRGKVGVVSLATSTGSAYVLDAKKLDPGSIRELLDSCLSGRPLIAHSAPFDLAFLKEAFGYLHDGPVYDTLVLDAMLFYATGPLTEKKDWKGFTTKDKETGYKRGLDEVVRDHLGQELDKEERDSDWGGDLTPAMIEYAAKDASVLIPLKDALVTDLEALGMAEVSELEARFTPAMAYCSANGFALDVEGWKQHASDAKNALEEAETKCNGLAPDPPEGVEWAWNASNHRKVGLALETLGAKVEKNPTTGNYKTDETALKAIKKPAKAKRLAEAILEYRANEKYVTTWGENWFEEPWLNTKGRVHAKSPDHLIVVDGRVYAKFNQLVATGRGSSKQPNMQNLPPEIRRFFVAPLGRKLLIADYSQIEYVAAAYMAGDEALLGPLREGQDFHLITARMILGDAATDEEVAAFRPKAKTVNFGILYGMGAKGLAKRLGTTDQKARGYINTVFSRAPKLAEWCRERGRKASAGARVAATPLGRKRLIDMNFSQRSNGWETSRSQMLNHPIQGGCADGYKMAGALIWERRNEFVGNPLIVNMVHDEYVLEVDAGTANHDARILDTVLVEGMKAAIGDAPVSVDVTIADNWGEKD